MNSGCFKKGQKSWNTGLQQSDSAKEKNRLAHLGKPAWNKGKKLGFIPKGAFKKGHSLNKGKVITEEHRKNLVLSHIGKMMGSDNPSWKGGITSLIQKIKRLTEYKDWFREILKRDKYTCRKCKVYSPPKLTAHHLKSFSFLINNFKPKTLDDAKQIKELWNLDNGVALCDQCHRLTPNYSYRAAKNPIDTNLYS